MKQYFEFKDEKSSKFWEIEQIGTSVATRYGKIGADGTTTTKEYTTKEEAQTETKKLIKSKLAKGYMKLGEEDITPEYNFPFPFFGAGNFTKFANDYVSYNLFFKSLPTKKQWEKIGSIIPDFLVHPAFKSYIAQGNIEDLCISLMMPEPTKDVIKMYYQSVSDPFSQYSVDIENVFLAINEISPLILVTIEDPEVSEGIEKEKKVNILSNWHYWSLTQVDQIFNLLKEEVYMNELNRTHVLSIIFNYLAAENLEYKYDFDAVVEGLVISREEESVSKKELIETFHQKYYPILKKVIFKASETAFKTLQEIKKTKEIGSLIIRVTMDYDNSQILFRYFDKKSKEECSFYTHKANSSLSEGGQMMRQIEEEGGITYSRALWNLFENAKLYNIKDKYTNFLDFAYQVPEADSGDEEENDIIRYYWGPQDNEDTDEDEDDWEKKNRAGEIFYSEYHGAVTNMVRNAIEGALNALQALKEMEKIGFLDIDVSMDWDTSNIIFGYIDEDSKKESLFYTHAIGSLMGEAYEVMERMEEEGGTPYSQALSNFFEDAGLSSIDKNLIKGLSFVLGVSDVGGSPYMHVVDGKFLN